MSNDIVKQENAFNIPNGYICTFDLSDKRNKLIVAKALNAATSLKDVNEPFVIKGIVTTPGTRSQSGSSCTNTYLIRDDGSAYFSQSDGIARSAGYIVGLFTADEIADGIKVFVNSISLDGGRTLKTLDFILE